MTFREELELIERIADGRQDALDRRYLNGEVTEDEYDEACGDIAMYVAVSSRRRP